MTNMPDDTFTFETAKQLRDFLNQFKDKDLSTVYLEGNNIDYISLVIKENDMGDGSSTTDFHIS